MERITLIGNIGQDAKTVEYQGNSFLSFSVACSTTKKNGNDTKEVTNWYDCAFDNIKLSEYIKKGTKVFIEGNFKLDTFWSEQSNKWIPKIRIFVQRIELLSPKKDDTTSPQQTPPVVQNNAFTASPVPVEMSGNDGDDLPF